MNRKENETMTAREFARRSGLGLQYVYVRIWSGKLPAEKRDGQWRIRASELERRNQAVAEEAVA